MNKKNYTLSSSDEESDSDEKFDSDEESDSDEEQKSSEASFRTTKTELLQNFMSNNKVAKYDFKNWKSGNTLFYDEISDDDELWLVQCPKNTDVAVLNNANLCNNSTVSNVKCRVNGIKEKLTVYPVDDFPEEVNLALPNRSTKSFQLKVIPVAGQLILQKNIKKKRFVEDFGNSPDTKMPFEDCENVCIDLEIASVKSEAESNDEGTSELPVTSKKQKRSN